MVPEPGTLEARATAQEAGQRLSDPAVRAVLVCDDGNLVGVITRKTLVREVVATGRDPRATTLEEIAEPPLFTLDAGLELDEAFRALEEHDLERVPVVEGANGPTSIEADAILGERGIPVLPDVLTNAGGVTVSYFEWVQDLGRLFWTRDEIRARLAEKLGDAFDRVWALAEKKGSRSAKRRSSRGSTRSPAR